MLIGANQELSQVSREIPEGKELRDDLLVVLDQVPGAGLASGCPWRDQERMSRTRPTGYHAFEDVEKIRGVGKAQIIGLDFAPREFVEEVGVKAREYSAIAKHHDPNRGFSFEDVSLRGEFELQVVDLFVARSQRREAPPKPIEDQPNEAEQGTEGGNESDEARFRALHRIRFDLHGLPVPSERRIKIGVYQKPA